MVLFKKYEKFHFLECNVHCIRYILYIRKNLTRSETHTQAKNDYWIDAFGNSLFQRFSLRIFSIGVVEHSSSFAMALADRPFCFNSSTFLLSMKLPFMVLRAGLPNFIPLLRACSLPAPHSLAPYSFQELWAKCWGFLFNCMVYILNN